VPSPARIGIADRLAILDDIGEHQISGCPGRANCVRGLISSSPNLRANAICCLGISF
jgi:hypothetical protein